MLNIYDFFNSRDIADHCLKLEHSFSAKEMAYLIWQSNHHTLRQKEQAWETLMATTTDEDLVYDGGRGLHNFLREYIARQKQFILDFQTGEDCVYSYDKLYADVPDRYLNESVLFTSYEACVAAAAAEAARDKRILSLCIRKRALHTAPVDWEENPSLFLTPAAEPKAIGIVPHRGERNLLVAPFGFYGMWVQIPTPFQQGDLVSAVNSCELRGGPGLICALPGESGEDIIDMSAKVWELDHQGRLTVCEDYGCLDLEYYRGELTKQNRFLYALCNHLRGELPMEELLRSYGITMLERFAETRVGTFGWGEGMLEPAGLAAEVITVR